MEFPYAVTPIGFVWMCAVNITKGKGQRCLLGHLDDMARDSMNTAISFVSINVGSLLSCLPDRGVRGTKVDHPSLYNKYTDVVVAHDDLDVVKEGPSTAALTTLCVIMAMSGGCCELATRRTCITGDIDLRSRLQPVGDIEAKIQVAMKLGMDLMVVPKDTLEDAKLDGDDVLEYAQHKVKGVENIVELMGLVIKGEAEEEWIGHHACLVTRRRPKVTDK